jgi:Fe-S cluster biogenesis protein NfuA
MDRNNEEIREGRQERVVSIELEGFSRGCHSSRGTLDASGGRNIARL